MALHPVAKKCRLQVFIGKKKKMGLQTEKLSAKHKWGYKLNIQIQLLHYNKSTPGLKKYEYPGY